LSLLLKKLFLGHALHSFPFQTGVATLHLFIDDKCGYSRFTLAVEVLHSGHSDYTFGLFFFEIYTSHFISFYLEKLKIRRL
jgi:hypothetical protein